MKKIILVVGARPNFMKAAPLYHCLKMQGTIQVILVHTGQHYDFEMSQVFFEDLNLPKPDYFLDVQSGSHAEQTAKIMVKFEKVLLNEKPSLVVVFGDVNSTVACSITAKKMQIAIAHVEAGLRSYDETMPEEINRRVTDTISDYLLTPSLDANQNLLKEGVSDKKIFFVGNIMIDSLSQIIKRNSKKHTSILKKVGLIKENYCLLTIHRPSNVDNKEKLAEIMSRIKEISRLIRVVFPVHPRTKKYLQELKLENYKNVQLLSPLGYNDFTCLEKNASFVVTDSGGIQEEAAYLGVPCLTLRPNTERPITIELGTNELVTEQTLVKKAKSIISGNWKRGESIPFWDGQTASRIAKILVQKLDN